ncbi:MAG TPA: DUF1349 domain-containing protein [bacterium]|nr:DUF1349 domain-containing protein [bacterium]
MKTIRWNHVPWLSLWLLIPFIGGASVCAENWTPGEYMKDGLCGEEIFRDVFKVNPEEPWAWIRENKEFHRSGEKGLEIRPEPGGLMGDGQDAKNILVKPLPPDAYLVTVYVQANHRSQYEQGGLILYLDDNNYIKFVLEMVDGKHWFVLVCELDAKPKVINKLPASEKGGWIILQLKDQTVTAFSCDGKVGTVKIGTADFPMEPRPRIGIFTQSGEPGSDRWVTFRDFVIYKATE